MNVLIPIPSASVSTATAVNPGERASIRSAHRKSLRVRVQFLHRMELES